MSSAIVSFRTRTKPQLLQEHPAIDRRYPLVRLLDEAAERFENSVGRPILRPQGWERDWNHWRNRSKEALRRDNARMQRRRDLQRRYGR